MNPLIYFLIFAIVGIIAIVALTVFGNRMTRRDKFAAAALQGILANDFQGDNSFAPKKRAELACKYADAMIAETQNDLIK